MPLVGAAIVAVAGLVPTMIIDAASFAAVTSALIMIIRPRYRLPRITGEAWTASLRGGLGYLRRDGAARMLTLGISSLNVFGAPVLGVGVALRVSASGWGASWVGIADACAAAGAIAGSVLAIRWQPRNRAARAFWVLVVQGAAIAAVGVPSAPTLLASMIILGITAGLASVWLSGVFQQTIAASHLGRVSSMSQLGDLALTPAVLPLFGVLVGATDILTATAVCGAGMAGLCLMFARRPEIRSLG